MQNHWVQTWRNAALLGILCSTSHDIVLPGNKPKIVSGEFGAALYSQPLSCGGNDLHPWADLGINLCSSEYQSCLTLETGSEVLASQSIKWNWWWSGLLGIERNLVHPFHSLNLLDGGLGCSQSSAISGRLEARAVLRRAEVKAADHECSWHCLPKARCMLQCQGSMNQQIPRSLDVGFPSSARLVVITIWIQWRPTHFYLGINIFISFYRQEELLRHGSMAYQGRIASTSTQVSCFLKWCFHYTLRKLAWKVITRHLGLI